MSKIKDINFWIKFLGSICEKEVLRKSREAQVQIQKLNQRSNTVKKLVINLKIPLNSATMLTPRT